ncbi:hypothetical protein HANVADRAFT_7984, partial [Hanseniaspora valbyensis NRRL Y-1626]
MTGYMIPPTTGNYTISLGYIDDLGIINMSAGKFLSENCCDNFSPTGNVDGSNTVKSIWSSSGPTGTNQISLYLYAGVAYPLEIFYVNRGALGAITLTYTDPSGVTSSDFSGIIYHYDDIDSCEYRYDDTVILPWTGTTTSTTDYIYTTTTVFTNTYYGTASTFTGQLIVETHTTLTPAPRATSTSTQGYFGSSTTTTATSVTTVYSDGTLQSIETIYYVDVPDASVVTTTYTAWDGSSTSTYATSFTTVTGDDGLETISATYYVETPSAATTTISFTAGDVTSATTYSTTVATVTGDDGV